MPPSPKDFPSHFWSRVDRSGGPDACWPWTGGRNSDGYGSLGRKGRSLSAHRIAWELSFGDPRRASVLHTCDNPPCVNPAHLWLGTQADNMRDRGVKGRAARGSRIPKTRLSPDAVRLIRQRLALGEPVRSIAADFGVVPNAIYQIIVGRTWAWV